MVVDEPGFLSNEHMRFKDPEPDKKAILADLKAGKDVPGAHLEKGPDYVVLK